MRFHVVSNALKHFLTILSLGERKLNVTVDPGSGTFETAVAAEDGIWEIGGE